MHANLDASNPPRSVGLLVFRLGCGGVGGIGVNGSTKHLAVNGIREVGQLFLTLKKQAHHGTRFNHMMVQALELDLVSRKMRSNVKS